MSLNQVARWHLLHGQHLFPTTTANQKASSLRLHQFLGLKSDITNMGEFKKEQNLAISES